MADIHRQNICRMSLDVSGGTFEPLHCAFNQEGERYVDTVRIYGSGGDYILTDDPQGIRDMIKFLNACLKEMEK